MKLDLQKVCNARDLGGIRCKSGRIKEKVLLRSGHLHSATAQDVQLLKQLGLQRVIDLRNDAETLRNPDIEIEGVTTERISVLNPTFGISFETLNGQQVAQQMRDGADKLASEGTSPEQYMQLLYKKFATEEFCAERFGKFLCALADRPVSGATLWHCTAGKDRCGVATALLLHCLGADRDEIMQDYLLSNTHLYDRTESILNKIAPYLSDKQLQIAERMITVDESYLQTFWKTAEERFGSADNFVSRCGVTEERKERLRALYLC